MRSVKRWVVGAVLAVGVLAGISPAFGQATQEDLARADGYAAGWLDGMILGTMLKPEQARAWPKCMVEIHELGRYRNAGNTLAIQIILFEWAKRHPAEMADPEISMKIKYFLAAIELCGWQQKGIRP